MTALERIREMRAASRIERCHTTPHHGSYTVGQHSYDMANLLLALHPEPSMELLKAVLWHDLHERWLGDTPTPTKCADPEIRRRLKILEDQCNEHLDIKVKLTPVEQRWLKAVDRIDLWLWAKEQVQMGNKEALTIQFDVEPMFDNFLPEECKKFVDEYKWEVRNDDVPKGW